MVGTSRMRGQPEMVGRVRGCVRLGATAAPGDPGFNGGRWRVIGLSFSNYGAALAADDTNGSGDFDTTAEVQSALADGSAVSLGVVKSFECPVIRMPGAH